MPDGWRLVCPIDAESSTERANRIISALAARQRGVVARRQLLAAGISATMIGRRRRDGRLHELHRGVYLVGHSVPPALALEQAALLACGDGAVLSHWTAASLWKLLPHPARRDVCITVPPARRIERPGIAIRRMRLVHRDIRRRHGLPVSSPPRTILDLAAEPGRDQRTGMPPRELEALIAEAQYRGLASEAELRRQVERNRGRRGVHSVATILDFPGGPRRTRSPSERELLSLLRRFGIDGFETNARIGGYEVDFLWRDEKLVVEVDGYAAHSGRLAFERDRLKAATLTANGLRVLPITGRQIRHDPRGVVSRVRRARAGANIAQ
jgi:very-short-patch-repair endonuclease